MRAIRGQVRPTVGHDDQSIDDRCERTRRGPGLISAKSAGTGPDKIRVGDLWFDALTEREVVDVVRTGWAAGHGGSIIPVNVDVALCAARDAALADLIARGSVVVADGMPLVWAARVKGDPLPERVAGSSLISSLCEAAAVDGKSIYLFGGAAGIPEQAAEALEARFATLRIAGTQSPEFGFDKTPDGARRAISAVADTAPDLVFVGLGFPRQERLIEQLRQELPNVWCLACGGGIAMAAGAVRRASPLIQRLGFEWLHRLLLEPRRLARRYLRDDLPFALALVARSAAQRLKRSR